MKDKTAEFVEKAKLVHHDENLDYSKVVYKNNRTPVCIIDHDIDDNGNEYGEFWQTPWNHLKGQSNPKKRAKKISKSKASKQDEIIKRFKDVHKGENLDYSQVAYVNMHTKVKIISHDLRPDGSEYGEFWQEPAVHLKGCSHPDIGKKKQIDSIKYTTEVFIEKAKNVHCDKDYCYDFVDYKNSKTKVKIICNKTDCHGKKHGEFMVSPDLFLMGKGCPKCGNHLSIAEDEIYEILKNKLGEKNVEKRNKTVLDGQEIDIYVPSKGIGFEFNGLRWHSEKFQKDHKYHLNKTLSCLSKNIFLIHIFEDEYIKHKSLVIDKIFNILKLNSNKKKAFGRNVKIKEIPTIEAKRFLNKYHIQGFGSGSVYLGGFLNNELISVMAFLRIAKDEWNLTRYATNIDFVCPGVASKTFTYFIRNYTPLKIISFLDRRWCYTLDSNLYEKIGFKIDKMLEPNYSYTNGHGERFHKFGFRKQILSKKYGFPLTMTESEMVKDLGYDRIWDCGLIRYIWTVDNKKAQP